MVVVPTTPTFLPDIDAIAASLTPRTRAILLNSPNNPSGAVYPSESYVALEELLQRVAPEVLVISDEPYKALTFDDVRAPEVAPLITRAIVATSWSKALAIPGERIGYIAISPRIAEAADLFAACSFAHRTLGFVNAPALWQWVVAETAEVKLDLTGYRAKRDRMVDALLDIGYRCSRPQAAFYVFPETPIADDVTFVGMLADEGVLTVPGSGFGTPGHIRISLTTPMATVEGALPGFRRAYERALVASSS